MLRYANNPTIQLPIRRPAESINERRDKFRGELKIAVPPIPDEELRKKWYGAPPSRLEIPRRPTTLAF